MDLNISFSMVFVMLKKCCLVCLWFVLSGNLLAQGNELELKAVSRPVLSSIDGNQALIEITDDLQWQHLLNINSSDLDELRALRSGNAIEKKLERKTFDNAIELRNARDILVKERLAEILDPRQMSLLRVSVIRKLYPSPIAVFKPKARLLIELGLTQVQFDAIVSSAGPGMSRIRSQVDDLASDFLNAVATRMSTEKATRLWHLFGREFKSQINCEVLWDQIQVLPNTDSKTQLMHATFQILDEELKLNQMQLAEILQLQNREFANFLRDSEAAVSADLDRILTKSQRTAIVQGLQRDKLIADFNVLLNHNVIKHVGLEKDEVESMIDSVNDYAKKIKDFKCVKQLELLESETSHLPKELRERLAELVEGVWIKKFATDP